MKPADARAGRRNFRARGWRGSTSLVKAIVIAVCAALTMTGCGTTSMVNGRAVSVLYDPADAGGLPVSEGASGPRANAPQPTGTVKNSDNGDIDRLALLALNDIEEFWKQNWPDAAKKPFKAVSTLVSYDSRDPQSPIVCRVKTYGSINAAFVFSCNLVEWDRGQLFPAAKKYFGDMSPVGILAHEFGHALQFNGGLVDTRSTPTLVKEQQADCFAGVYLRWVAEGHSARFTLSTGDALSHVIAGMLKTSDPIMTEEELQESENQAHGTGLDRVSAFQMGFDSGSATCAKIDMNEIKKRRGDEPLALQQDSSGEADTGEVAIDNDNVGTLIEILNKVFSPKSPPTLSFTNTPCADAKPTKGASYCPATNTVTADLPTLQQIGKPGGRKGMTDPMMLQGDNTAMSIITSRYVLAVQHERGLPLDSAVTAVRTACLTGAAQRNMAQPVSVPSGKQLVLTAGDLDKALIGLLMNGVAASDVNGANMPAGFTRVLAFRAGVLDNIDECFPEDLVGSHKDLKRHARQSAAREHLQRYGLGTRPALTSVSCGRVAKVTAGNRNSSPLLSRARAQEPLVKRSPSMSSQRTVWLPSSFRTVTPCSSATVRSRTINADNTTGMTSSGVHGGQASTGISSPRVKNPTAKCAIGETLITTGDSVATSHHSSPDLAGLPRCAGVRHRI